MSQWERSGSLAVIICVGIALGVLGITRFASEMVLLPSLQTLKDVRNGDRVSRAELDALVSSHATAAAMTGAGRVWTDLGLAQLRLAEQRGLTPVERRRLLLEARQSVRRGLERTPSNPFAWSRLAHLQILLVGNARSAVGPLMRSIETAPNERRLYVSRASALLLLWSNLSPEQRSVAEIQIQRGWRAAPLAIAEQAYRLRATDVLIDSVGDPNGVSRALDKIRRSL